MINRRPWTQEEKSAVKEHLGNYIKLRQCPGKKECEEAKKDIRLKDRHWSTIKFFIKNQFPKKVRM